MKTKYGTLNTSISQYGERLVGKIYKLLPLKEENNPTLDKYIDSLLVELHGGNSVVISFQENPDYLCMVNSLEGIKSVDDMSLFRRKVFECISICKKLS